MCDDSIPVSAGNCFTDSVSHIDSHKISLDTGHIYNRHLSVAVDVCGKLVKVGWYTDADKRALDIGRVEDRYLTVAVRVAEDIARGSLALLGRDRDGGIGIDFGDTEVG